MDISKADQYWNEHPGEWDAAYSSLKSARASLSAKQASSYVKAYLSLSETYFKSSSVPLAPRMTAVSYARPTSATVYHTPSPSYQRSVSSEGIGGIGWIPSIVIGGFTLFLLSKLVFFLFKLFLFFADWIYLLVNRFFFPDHWSCKERHPGCTDYHMQVAEEFINWVWEFLIVLVRGVWSIIYSICHFSLQLTSNVISCLLIGLGKITADAFLRLFHQVAAGNERLRIQRIHLQNSRTYTVWTQRYRRCLSFLHASAWPALILLVVLCAVLHLRQVKVMRAAVALANEPPVYYGENLERKIRNREKRYYWVGSGAQEPATMTVVTQHTVIHHDCTSTVNWNPAVTVTESATEFVTKKAWSNVHVEEPALTIHRTEYLSPWIRQYIIPKSRSRPTETVTETVRPSTKTIYETVKGAVETFTEIIERSILSTVRDIPSTVTETAYKETLTVAESISLDTAITDVTMIVTKTIVSTATKWRSEVKCDQQMFDTPDEDSKVGLAFTGYDVECPEGEGYHYCQKCRRPHSGVVLVRRAEFARGPRED